MLCWLGLLPTHVPRFTSILKPCFMLFHAVPLCKSTGLQESKRCESVWAMAPSLGMYEQWHHASEFLGIKKWRNELWLSTNLRWPLELSCFAGQQKGSQSMSIRENGIIGIWSGPIIESQLLRQLKLQWAQCLDERHRLNVTNGTTKLDHASQNKNMAAICSMTKTCSYFNLSHSTCPSHFHDCRSKSREWIAMLCHTCETLVCVKICTYCLHQLYLHIQTYSLLARYRSVALSQRYPQVPVPHLRLQVKMVWTHRPLDFWPMFVAFSRSTCRYLPLLSFIVVDSGFFNMVTSFAFNTVLSKPKATRKRKAEKN